MRLSAGKAEEAGYTPLLQRNPLPWRGFLTLAAIFTVLFIAMRWGLDLLSRLAANFLLSVQ